MAYNNKGIKMNIKMTASDKVSATKSFDKYIESLSKTNLPKFNQDLFDEGEKWGIYGFEEKDIPEKFRNNPSFINGYNKGKRMIFMRKEQEKRGISK